MMRSNEARRKSQEVILNHQTKELKTIDKLINDAVERGEMQCSFEGNISKITKSELERCGYKVYLGAQYNQDYVVISW